ncbi:hypothetical protein [Longitalea luteola]|uniref:hypothetical protein n=1 Tax=Longitalea luteola TaxID=2812563 RepID=UPI001A97772B|nr:hypothetical protein [Longitalea luteola]
MQVMINGRLVDYISDFDPVDIQSNVTRNWRVSAGDYFKFPVRIADANCFVKRFDRKDTDISGYKLLLRLKGKRLSGLPFIHDLVRVREGNKEILYLFTEYLPGNTLEDLQRKGFRFLPQKLSSDLYAALHSIHQQGFWFPDFDPKNLYRANTGDFYLIDLDSTYSLDELPKAKMFGSKDYWAPVYNFYRQVMGFTSEEIKQLKGDAFNTLHLLYFICLYSYFLYDDGIDLTTTTIEKINDHYYKKYKLFGSTLRYCFCKNPNTGQLQQKPLTLDILNSFVNNCLFPEQKEVFLSKHGASQKPVVQFGVKGGKTVYQPGEMYQLIWNAVYVDIVNLDGEPQSFSGNRSFVSSATKVHKLTIGFKQNGALKYIDHSVTIKVEPRPQLTLTAHSTKVRANRPATLTWEVKNGKNIDLLLNGQIHKSNCAGKDALQITLPFDPRTAGVQRATLQLVARSMAEGIEYRSAPLQIEVVQPVRFNAGWLIVPLLVIGIIWIILGKACSSDGYAYSSENTSYAEVDTVAMAAVDTTAAPPALIDTTAQYYPAAPAPETDTIAKTSNKIDVTDEFVDNSSGWQWDGSSDASTEIADGNLLIKMLTDVPYHPGTHYSIDQEKPFTVAARMGRGDFYSTGSYGIYCTNSRQNTIYLFVIRPGGYYEVGKFENDSWTSLAKGVSENINKDTYYNVLKISHYDNYLYLYVNGNYLTSVVFEMNDLHYFGVYAEAVNTSVFVDYFNVTGTNRY